MQGGANSGGYVARLHVEVIGIHIAIGTGDQLAQRHKAARAAIAPQAWLHRLPVIGHADAQRVHRDKGCGIVCIGQNAHYQTIIDIRCLDAERKIEVLYRINVEVGHHSLAYRRGGILVEAQRVIALVRVVGVRAVVAVATPVGGHGVVGID